MGEVRFEIGRGGEEERLGEGEGERGGGVVVCAGEGEVGALGLILARRREV